MLTSSSLLLVVAGVAVVAAAVVLVVLLRRRRPGLDIAALGPADAERYLRDFAAIEAEAGERPQPAAGRARGMVEEVLRRMGFPDRLDSAQKARDVAAYDRDLARVLAEADIAIRGAGADPARLEHAIGLYRQALEGLLPRTELENG